MRRGLLLVLAVPVVLWLLCPGCGRPDEEAERSAVGLVPAGFVRRAVTSPSEAAAYAEAYARALRIEGVRPYQIAEFHDRFFVYLEESSTHKGAFGVDIGRDGSLGPLKFPAMDPDMMWNDKYGHEARREPFGGPMDVTATEARNAAKAEIGQGPVLEDPKEFYGYYLFSVTEGGHVVGQAAVNGRNGDVVWQRWPRGFQSLVVLPYVGSAR